MQNLSSGILTGDVLPPSNFYHGESSKSTEHEEALVEDNCKPQISVDGSMQQQPDGWNLIDLPGQYQMNVESANPEDVFQSPDDLNGLNLDDLLDATFLDACDNPVFEDTPYLHTVDPSNPAETNSADFNPDEFFKFFDAEDNMFMANDSSEMMMMGIGNNYFDESLFAPENKVSYKVLVHPSFVFGLRWDSS